MQRAINPQKYNQMEIGNNTASTTSAVIFFYILYNVGLAFSIIVAFVLGYSVVPRGDSYPEIMEQYSNVGGLSGEPLSILSIFVFVGGIITTITFGQIRFGADPNQAAPSSEFYGLFNVYGFGPWMGIWFLAYGAYLLSTIYEAGWASVAMAVIMLIIATTVYWMNQIRTQMVRDGMANTAAANGNKDSQAVDGEVSGADLFSAITMGGGISQNGNQPTENGTAAMSDMPVYSIMFYFTVAFWMIIQHVYSVILFIDSIIAAEIISGNSTMGFIGQEGAVIIYYAVITAVVGSVYVIWQQHATVGLAFSLFFLMMGMQQHGLTNFAWIVYLLFAIVLFGASIFALVKIARRWKDIFALERANKKLV